MADVKVLTEEEVLENYSPQQRSAAKLSIAFSCAIWKTQHIKSHFISFILFFIYMIYYTINWHAAKAERDKRFLTLDVHQIRLVWEYAERSAFFRFLSRLNSPSCSIVQRTHIDDVPVYLISHKPLSQSRPGYLLHIHGGGMSTCTPLSHLGYLKQWSKDLNLPIVSVEYSLAPEFKHPTALNEITKVYKWLLKNSHQLGLKTDKIIVGGDSAGGYFSLTLTLSLIRDQIRIPDGLILIYPYTSRNSSAFPSRTKFTNDLIISSKFSEILSICDYDPKKDDPNDMLLSPINAPEDMWKHFPKSFIFVGTQDPLHDESVALNEKLKKADVSVKLKEYKNWTHGWFNLLDMFAEAKVSVKDTAEAMEEILA